MSEPDPQGSVEVQPDKVGEDEDEISAVTMPSMISASEASSTTAATSTASTSRGAYSDNADVWAHAEKSKCSSSSHDKDYLVPNSHSIDSDSYICL